MLYLLLIRLMHSIMNKERKNLIKNLLLFFLFRDGMSRVYSIFQRICPSIWFHHCLHTNLQGKRGENEVRCDIT